MHLFKTDISNIPLPERFTFPFHYTPHPLCIQAAEDVQTYLSSRTDWHEELQQGKMFGVLIVRDDKGRIGYLSAFSGILAGSNRHDYFVPPVFDFLQPTGYFRQEEMEISGINRRIAFTQQSAEFVHAHQELERLETEAKTALLQARNSLKEAKKARDIRRENETLSENELTQMIKESQHGKAALKRLEQEWKERIARQQAITERHQQAIDAMKEERKKRSAALQQWLFRQFCLLNARGEQKNLCQIFAETPQQTPPSGAGECAAPKLLQYAYQQKLSPVAMAEFWWGNSPKGEIRRHGYFYPSCKSKCEPILKHMLQGLRVDPNPLLIPKQPDMQLQIIHEDEYLLVVNKPAGMLSVPGKSDQPSVYSIIREKYPQATGPLIVHRLDMDTSGLLLIAKDKKTHAYLQAEFESRNVKKRYIALLDGIISSIENKGFIRLPICPDYENRPMQMVDYENGKPSVTRYKELGHTIYNTGEKSHLCTRIAYWPQTGRTHQLRVHSAHPDGLNCPILGDPLYGQAADRLYLHAEQLEFRHPSNGKIVKFKAEAGF